MDLFYDIRIRDALQYIEDGWALLCPPDNDNCSKCKYERMCNGTSDLLETFTSIVESKKAEYANNSDNTISSKDLIAKISRQKEELTRLNDAIKEYQKENLSLQTENIRLENRLHDVESSIIGLQNRIDNLKELNKILASSRHRMFGKGGK